MGALNLGAILTESTGSRNRQLSRLNNQKFIKNRFLNRAFNKDRPALTGFTKFGEYYWVEAFLPRGEGVEAVDLE